MGLLLKVEKNNNALYTDFPDAYWKIENILVSHQDGEDYIVFDLNTYPSREASKMTLVPIDNTFPLGGAVKVAYEPMIRHWQGMFKASDIFKGGTMPISEKEQKKVIYAFVKAHTNLGFEDVIED